MNGKTHPADGLYYLTYTMLGDYNACSWARVGWAREFGKEKRIPISYALALHATNEDNDYDISWAVNQMYYNERITKNEYHAFYEAYNETYYREVEATLFMDLLAKRARREGRLK